MKITTALRVHPGRKFKLADRAPDATPGTRGKASSQDKVARAIAHIDRLQYRLYAENRRALLILLQGIDAAGKDGTIRHVMTGLNPQGCSVTAFKVPSSEEADHDFLWRIHKAVPARGDIGIFNRSHYEDLIVPRVKQRGSRGAWAARCRQINEFELYLVENDVALLKCFLHISKDEQKRRLEQRLEDPTRHWKVNPADFTERERWNEYMAAFSDMLHDCSTPWAPWYVIPSDHKWYRNFAISRLAQEALEEMDPKLPETTVDLSQIRLR